MVMESSAHCTLLYLIHQQHPTTVGLFTTNIPLCLLQPFRKPIAPKTSQTSPELGTLPATGVKVKLGGSEMVPVRLCTKSCPDTVCSLLRTRSRGRSTPPARTQRPWGCCPAWRAHGSKQRWLEGPRQGGTVTSAGWRKGKEHHMAGGRSHPIPGCAAGGRRTHVCGKWGA